MVERFCIDTSLLIPLMNERRHEDRFLDLSRRSKVCISVVTANELLRGCHDNVSLEIVEGFINVLQGELLTPSESQWLECAEISEGLLKEKKRSKQNVLLLQNDILIALGARDIGATLVTCDKKDFNLLKPYVRVPIEFW